MAPYAAGATVSGMPSAVVAARRLTYFYCGSRGRGGAEAEPLLFFRGNIGSGEYNVGE